METEKMNNKLSALLKIWILYFLISAVVFFIKNGGDELMSMTIFIPVTFLIMIFDYVIFD